MSAPLAIAHDHPTLIEMRVRQSLSQRIDAAVTNVERCQILILFGEWPFPKLLGKKVHYGLLMRPEPLADRALQARGDPARRAVV